MDTQAHLAYLAAVAAHKTGTPRWGLIASYNQQDHTAKVYIQPENILSGELPINPMGGARYAPFIGQMAHLAHTDADSQALVISGFSFNDQNPPPSTPNDLQGSKALLQSGEWEAVGGQGQTIRLCADGTILIQGSSDVKIQAPNVQIMANLNVSGTITCHGDVVASSGSLNDAIQELNQHEHIVDLMGGPSEPTMPQFDVQPESLPPVQ